MVRDPFKKLTRSIRVEESCNSDALDPNPDICEDCDSDAKTATVTATATLFPFSRETAKRMPADST